MKLIIKRLRLFSQGFRCFERNSFLIDPLRTLIDLVLLAVCLIEPDNREADSTVGKPKASLNWMIDYLLGFVQCNCYLYNVYSLLFLMYEIEGNVHVFVFHLSVIIRRHS